MPNPIGGQSSGDFRETSGRVQILYVVTRNSLARLSPDAFTQANPPVITTQKSSTLANITKVGVLGSTVAFSRPDVGNGYVGGPVAPGGVYAAGQRPLGIFINDSLGNPYENTPGVASGMGPYLCGSGTTLSLSLYETKVQLGGGAGTAITYAVGDKLFASVNGLVTNVILDAYERNVAGAANTDVTVMGIVKAVPDASFPFLVIDVRV